MFKNLREDDILKVDDGLEPASVMLEILFFSFSDRPGVCRGMLLAVLKPRNSSTFLFVFSPPFHRMTEDN